MMPVLKSKELDIAIVGAGTLGTALAYALHQSGYRVTEIVTRDQPHSLRRARVFANRRLYEAAQRAGRIGQLPFVRDGKISHLPGPLGGWSAMRDLQPVPEQSFRDWWRERT